MGQQKVVWSPLGKLAQPSSKQFVIDTASCCDCAAWEVVFYTEKTARTKRVVPKVQDKVLCKVVRTIPRNVLG